MIDDDTRYSSHGTQGLNPDHKFIATMNESGEQDDKEKEMEENMAEVRMEEEEHMAEVMMEMEENMAEVMMAGKVTSLQHSGERHYCEPEEHGQ